MCGSLVSSLGVMDTVIVSGVVHYDFDLSAIDNLPVGQYPEETSPIISAESEYLSVCSKVISNVQSVICASADKFVSDSKIKKNLYETYGAKVCDMECAGVLLTAKGAGVPCVIIKAVSDGEGGAEEFNRCVHVASTAYINAVKELVKEF